MSTQNATMTPPSTIDDVPGWFPKLDRDLFTWFLERQEAQDVSGDLLELGCYMGKSAVLIGRHLRQGERFTVCDLFESPPPDEHVREEMNRSYASLTRAAFETNYLAFHDALPAVIQGPSSIVLDEVEAGSCRFVHVDASHLYEHVAGDIEAARIVLGDGGVVVCDDYRSAHTPGVAAATWEAVVNGGLRPVCVSRQKMYGTWGDPAPIQDELLEWAAGQSGVWHEVQDVAGGRLVRLKPVSVPKQARGNVADLQKELEKSKKENAKLREALRKRDNSLQRLRGSASFRVGRALTAAPRALRGNARGNGAD